MRNTEGEQRGTWATYIRAARERVGLSQIAFARAAGVDRATVYRWENGRTTPDDLELIQRIAEVVGLDAEELLAAAGLKLGVTPPPEPTIEPDPEIEAILRSGLPRRIQEELIAYVEDQRRQDHDRRMAELRRAIRLAGGQVA